MHYFIILMWTVQVNARKGDGQQKIEIEIEKNQPHHFMSRNFELDFVTA